MMTSPQSSARTHRHTLILCHPDANSFCASIADRYRQTAERVRHEVIVRDLYRMGFDPVLKACERPTSTNFKPSPDVEAELALIGGSDIFALVYPIWFGTPPAMMKGYVERVLGAGFSHHAIRQRRFHPIMTGKHMISFTSSATSQAWLNEKAVWSPLQEVFDNYIGKAFSMASTQHVHFSSIVDDLKERYANEILFKVEETTRKICAHLEQEKR